MARPAGAGTSGKGCGIGGSSTEKSVDLGLGRRSRSTVDGCKFQVSSFRCSVAPNYLDGRVYMADGNP